MIFIGKYKEFNPHSDQPSITESFSDKPYPGKEKIVHYLTHGNPGILCASIPHDVVTGETIPLDDLIMDDGTYAWPLILAYYVDRYNVRLPEEFEEVALTKEPASYARRRELLRKRKREKSSRCYPPDSTVSCDCRREEATDE